MTKETSGKDYIVCDQCRAKKIRCGREKPSCANCTRLGQKCEWSAQGKKCNQTALLSHTIIGLSSRVQSPETSALETQNSLKRLFRESSIAFPAPAKPQASQTWPTVDSSASQSPDIVTKPVFTRPLGRFLTNLNDDNSSGERYFGPTSLESLVLDIKDVIAKLLGSESQRLRECALLAQRKIDLLIGRGHEELIKDGSPPTAPPFAILDAMIEPYFATINPHFPIWTKEQFNRMATALRQSTSPEQNAASIISCNNLILMTLTANSLRSRWGRPVQIKHAHKSSSIDFDVTTGFLTNAKRAIENIELVLSPRLVNVQALLSLCAVAQEHLSSTLLMTLFTLAAQCAKSIGIHQWQCFRGQLSAEDAQERRNVSYCLYILDKAVCWTIGTSPSIPISDVQIDSTLMSPDDSTTALLVAKAELATIEETIYLGIYASQVKARTEDQVRQLVSRVSRRLENWLANSGTDLNEVENGLESSPSKVELAIDFLCAQLLLLWPYKEHPDIMFQQRTEIAQRCMRLLLRLWSSASDQGHRVALPRLVSHSLLLLATVQSEESVKLTRQILCSLIASHPPLYLHEICVHILSGQGQDSDTDLLRNFIEMLQTITDSREGESYNKRLCHMSLILMDVIAATSTQCKRRKKGLILERSTATQSPIPDRRISIHSPTLDTYSLPYSSSNSQMSPLVPESDYQTSGGHVLQEWDGSLVFPEWDDPLALMTPISARNGDFSQSSADELVSTMEHYAKGLFENLELQIE